MDKNIQDEDDELFRNAYNSFGEDPGPEVWEKLNAQLDKKDAIYYRAKMTVWKRSAYALLLLLACFVSYEYIFKTDKKVHQEINTKKHEKQTSSDSLDVTNTKPPAYKTAPDSLQAINKSTPPSLLSGSTTTNKANLSQSSSGADNTTAKDLINKNKIITKNRVHSSRINAGEMVVKSEKNVQNTRLKEQESISNLKTINKADSAVNTTNEAISIHHNKDSFSTQNEVFNKNEIAKTNTNISAADSNNTVTKPNEKPTVINEKKSDSSAAANHSTATKTTIKINHLFTPHWSFSPYAALDFSGQRLDDDDRHPEPGNRDARHEIEERENDQVSYSLGMLARYQLSKKISLKTGLIYINSSVKINPQTLYAAANGQDVNYKLITSSGYAYVKPSFAPSPAPGDSIHTEVASNKLSYLSIPFMAGYTIHTGKKFTITPGVGFSANVLLHSKISTEVHGNNENEKSNIVINKIQGMDRLNFSFIADAEMHYKIANKWSLLLLPSFKYAINPITKEHVVKTYPYNFSLGLGVTYGF